MKKNREICVTSMTHSTTSVFEIEPGEGFYASFPFFPGAEKLYRLTMQIGRKEEVIWFFKAKERITVISDDDGIGTSMRRFYGTPVFRSARAILPHGNREVGFVPVVDANTISGRKARRLCHENNILRVTMSGDYAPIWYKDDVLVADYTTSGTGYFIAPAWILEKAGITAKDFFDHVISYSF